MFTVCPKCALTLVVTAADLRVAQGYVRCGRCSNVFNALARLSEDRDAAAAQSHSAQLRDPAPPSPRPPPPPQPPLPSAPPPSDESLPRDALAQAALSEEAAELEPPAQ